MSLRGLKSPGVGSGRTKICHVLYGLGIGGIETLAVKLINRLPEDRFSHVILSLTPDDALVGSLEPEVPKYFLEKRPGLDARIYGEVLGILRRERPDVVHTRNWSTLLEGVLPSHLASVSGRLHSFDGLNATDLGPEPRRRIVAQRLILSGVEKLVARSAAMRQAMCEQLKLPQERISLIADGIDLEAYDEKKDREAVRRRYGLDASHQVVGIVARLDPVKDHQTLFRAIARLLPSYPRLRLLVVGGGPLEQELRQMAAASSAGSAIVFTGAQREMPPLYQAMDIYAQPSLYEGVSGSILEAMASRLPVVSTPVGGTVDIVLEGQTGLLAKVGDDAALSRALERLLTSKEEALRLAQGGRTLVESRYSLSRVLELYGAAYEEAAAGGRV